MIFQILITLLLAVGLLLIIFGSMSLPSVKEQRQLKRLGKPKESFSIERSVVLPIARKFEKYVRLNSVNKKQLENKLNIARYTMSAELYTARNITFAVLLFLFALVLLQFHIPILYLFSFVFFTLSVISYYKLRDEVDDRLKKKRQAIKKELLQFMLTIIQSLKFSRDVTAIADKYRLVAGPELRAELNVLVLDLKTINQEQSLRAFAQRIDIDDLTTFVDGLISESRGVNQVEYLKSVEKELKKKTKEGLKKEAFKKPGRLRIAQFAVVASIILVWLTAIGFQVVSNYLYTFNY